MTKTKLILGGVAGTGGLAGLVIIPLLTQSSNKNIPEGKVFLKSWPKDTNKDTSFGNFGDAFAPFLIDVDKTDDLFWEKRIEAAKSVSFEDSSLIFSNWNRITDKQNKISEIKRGCKDFQNRNFDHLDWSDVANTFQLCGNDDFVNKKPTILGVAKNGNELKAQQICNLLSEISKESCGSLGISVTLVKR